MSGIVGSYFNTRGSGVVAKLGTDGQVFTSTGAGLSQGFEAAAGGGKVLQVVHMAKTDATQATATASWSDVSGMTATITPTASDSTILVTVSANVATDEQHSAWKIVDGAGSDITGFIGDADGSRPRSSSTLIYDSTDSQGENQALTFKDSPASTSAETYKMQWRTSSGSHVLSINCSSTDGDSAAGFRGVSTITLLEIGA